MATPQDLVDEIKAMLRESDLVEVSIAQLQTFINAAVRDATSSGWLKVLEDDESLEFAANTYEYNVPASFAYVSELRVENTSTTVSTWDEVVDRHFWDIRLDSSVPKFFIHRGYPLPTGKAMKVIGQERPTLYSALTDTVDPGFEPFLRERALAFAMRFQATANPSLEVDQKQLALVDRAMAYSEALLARHPQENRVNPSAEYVPGR